MEKDREHKVSNTFIIVIYIVYEYKITQVDRLMWDIFLGKNKK